MQPGVQHMRGGGRSTRRRPPLIADGGGVIITGPRPGPVPPWNPVRPALSALEAAVSAESIGPTALRLAARRAALVEARDHIDAAIAEIDDFGAPAPRGVRSFDAPPCAEQARSD